jgi:hypothetical protein
MAGSRFALFLVLAIFSSIQVVEDSGRRGFRPSILRSAMDGSAMDGFALKGLHLLLTVAVKSGRCRFRWLRIQVIEDSGHQGFRSSILRSAMDGSGMDGFALKGLVDEVLVLEDFLVVGFVLRVFFVLGFVLQSRQFIQVIEDSDHQGFRSSRIQVGVQS